MKKIGSILYEIMFFYLYAPFGLGYLKGMHCKENFLFTKETLHRRLKYLTVIWVGTGSYALCVATYHCGINFLAVEPGVKAIGLILLIYNCIIAMSYIAGLGISFIIHETLLRRFNLWPSRHIVSKQVVIHKQNTNFSETCVNAYKEKGWIQSFRVSKSGSRRTLHVKGLAVACQLLTDTLGGNQQKIEQHEKQPLKESLGLATP